MNILILDDQEIIFGAPADYFVDPHDFRNDNVIQVATRDNFMNMFINGTPEGPWDMVWLDHDLGNPEFNGREITKWIAEFVHEGNMNVDNIQFWITTMNPHTSKTMYMDLDHYTDAIVHRYDMSSLRDFGISRGGIINPRYSILRRPSGFLVMP
jgi:hypothetical protein